MTVRYECHRESDRELLGWVERTPRGWVSIDRLGRPLTIEQSRDDAGRALRARGLGYLADRWQLDLPEVGTIPVRLVEVSEHRIVVKEEDFGDVFHETSLHVLPFPAPSELHQG